MDNIGGIKLQPKPLSYKKKWFKKDQANPPKEQNALLSLTKDEINEIIKKKDIKKVFIICNPFSGNGKGKKSLSITLNIFKEKNIETIVKKTEYKLHATDIAKTLSFNNIDAICIIGGDGTFNEVITGLMQRKEEDDEKSGEVLNFPPIGLIAGGTGNSILTSFKLLDIKQAVLNICDGYYRYLDLGQVTVPLETEIYDAIEESKPQEESETINNINSISIQQKTQTRYSFNMMGWGLGVEANIQAEKFRCFGPMRYDCGALISIIKNPQYKLKAIIDNEEINGEYSVIMIQNNIHSGSEMIIAPYAKADDGLFDILLCKNVGRNKLIHMFDELKRKGSHIYLDYCDYRQAKSLKLFSEPDTLINLDGENVIGTPFELKVLHRIIPIFFPLPTTNKD